MSLPTVLKVTHTVCRLGQPLAVIDNLPGEGAERTPIQMRQLAAALIQAACDCEAALDLSRRWHKTRCEYVLGAAPEENAALMEWSARMLQKLNDGNRLRGAIDDAIHYETPSIRPEEADARALALLGQLDGLNVASVRQVLNRAGFWLDAVSTLNCGEATEFARAVEGLRRAAGESL